MSIFNDIASGFSTAENLRDYSHASKLFRSDNFANVPRHKFLFHVYFTLNVPTPSMDNGKIGALVKSINLPSFNLDTTEYVQYNRKRLVHNKIEYQPINVKFHDDSADTIRSLWFNYYNYYFADSSYDYQNGSSAADYTNRNLYDDTKSANEWGYSTASNKGAIKPAFFKDIIIYGLSRGTYVSYTLVNPMITNWQGDTYDYSQDAGLMEHNMTVKYEAVKYNRGDITKENVLGFGDDSRYDNHASTLSRGGTTSSLYGESGAVATALDLAKSGNILGAIRTGSSFVNTFKSSGLGFVDTVKADLLTKAKSELPSVLNNITKPLTNTSTATPTPSVPNNAQTTTEPEVINTPTPAVSSSTVNDQFTFSSNTRLI